MKANIGMGKLRKHLMYGVQPLIWRWRARRPLFCVKGPVFIVGTGRSGTHFLTRVLISHPSLTDLMEGKENPYVFHQVTRASLDSSSRATLLPLILQKYRILIRAAAPLALVDQSHPNLFHYQFLSDEFPQARFIGLIRDPLSVIYSMMQHSGVLRWMLNWEDFPVPNEFLGIRRGEELAYRRLTLAERSALRWVAHIERMNDAASELSDRISLVRYEDLCLHPEAIGAKLAGFLSVDDEFTAPPITYSSLTKKDALASEDREAAISIIRSRLPPNLEHRISDLLSNYSL